MLPRAITTVIGAAVVGLFASPAAHAQFGAYPGFSTAPGALMSPLFGPYAQFSTRSAALMWPLNGGYAQFSALPGGILSTGDALYPSFAITPRAVLLTQGAAGTGVNVVPTGVGGASYEMSPTDPLVRQAQVGAPSIGVLANLDPETGLGYAFVPGAGNRVVRTAGAVIQTAAGPAIRAVDAATGIEFLALMPAEVREATDPGPLVAARVVRVTDDAVILEREEDGEKVIEIRPVDRVYTAVTGGFVPAETVRPLRPGLEVFIPVQTGARGTIRVQRPAGFGTRVSSDSVEIEEEDR